MERFVAGIDFGTSNSSASISNGKTTKIIPLEDGKPTIPTTICYAIANKNTSVADYLQSLT